MSHRQLADRQGHRWDVEDEGPLRAKDDIETDVAGHQLRFTRDDGAETVRTAPAGLDRLADIELRAILERGETGEVRRGPDEDTGGGYGDAA